MITVNQPDVIAEDKLILILKDSPKMYNIINLSEDFIKNNIENISMDRICETQNLSEDFIFELQDRIEFTKLSEKILKNMSINFYSEFKDKLNWNFISLIHRDLSSDSEINFIEKFKDKLNWNYISYMDLDDKFISKFENYLNLSAINFLNDFNLIREKSKISAEKWERKIGFEVSIKEWKEKIVETLKEDNLMKVDNLYVDKDGKLHAKIGDNIIKISI